MRRFVRVVMFVFMLLVTVAIFAYVSLFVLVSDTTLREIHAVSPAMQYISSFLGVYDIGYLDDGVYEMKQRIGSNLAGFVDWKQSGGVTTVGDHRLRLEDERKEIALYSPIRQFKGEVSGDLQSLQLIFSHKGRDVTKVVDIPTERTLDGYMRQYEAHLGKEMLFNGTNDYLIEASFGDGEVISRRITLIVDYQRIQVGDTVLYVDAGYIPADDATSIMWDAPDFEGGTTHFITYGCDATTHAPPLLTQQTYQYKSLPACMTFSVDKDYLFWFEFRQQTATAREYDIFSSEKGVLYRNFPLFYHDLHTTYMSLVFRDPVRERLEILKSRGDVMSYALEIIYYDPMREYTVLTITHTDGNKLLVENEKEKMYIYLYKDRSYTTGLMYPGVRYKFRYQGKEINQGPMYTLPIRLYSPRQPFGSTFMFSLSVDDTILYIDDGIKRMSFDMLLIGKTIEVEDVVHTEAQPGVCEGIIRDIYQNTLGKDLEDARVQDTLWLTARGVYAPFAKIYHKETESMVDVEQLYQGWLHLRLSSEAGTLVRGENTYQLRVYNEKEKELCRLEKKIGVY